MITHTKTYLSFVSQIKNANPPRKFLLSDDVTNLFTNIPLEEIIDLSINHIFNHNANLNNTKIEFKETFLFLLLRRLILFLTKSFINKSIE